MPNKDPLSTYPTSPIHNPNMDATLVPDDLSVVGAFVVVSFGALVVVVALALELELAVGVVLVLVVVVAPFLASHSAFFSEYVLAPVHFSHL